MATSSPTPQELRELAIAAAQLGGEALLHASTPRTAITKELPGDVVTEVDRAIELRIREQLAAVRPNDRIVGEELPDSGAGTTGLEWFIDPIDGTSNFVHGLALHCTSVAVYDSARRIWLAGAVHVPASAVTYAAAVDAGAQKVFADGTAVELTAAAAPGVPRLLAVGLSYDPDVRARQLDDVRQRMDEYDDMRSLGTAAYALCLVAEGVFATFVETDLFVYDWAAGALIAEEAGAVVERPDGLGRGAIVAHGLSPRIVAEGGWA